MRFQKDSRCFQGGLCPQPKYDKTFFPKPGTVRHSTHPHNDKRMQACPAWLNAGLSTCHAVIYSLLHKESLNKPYSSERVNENETYVQYCNSLSFIGSFNTRCTIAKKDKNKQGRSDLRQINYALFCTRKDHFPLYFDVFEGNRHDSKKFNVVIDNFFKAFQARVPKKEGMTIVFDKGNNSEENLKKFIKALDRFCIFLIFYSIQSRNSKPSPGN